jgi:hypothetical protein
VKSIANKVRQARKSANKSAANGFPEGASADDRIGEQINSNRIEKQAN